MEVCPAWVKHRRVLLKTNGSRDLSRDVLVEAIVRGGAEACEAVTFSCEAVMQAKEVVEHERELSASVSRPRRPVRQTSRNDLRPLVDADLRRMGRG